MRTHLLLDFASLTQFMRDEPNLGALWRDGGDDGGKGEYSAKYRDSSRVHAHSIALKGSIDNGRR